MDGLPPASAAIFTSYLYHSTSAGKRVPRAAIRRQPAVVTSSAHLERRVAAIAAGVRPGECAMFAAMRKEAEVLAVFASLTVAESRGLYARLWNPKSADPLARALQDLNVDSMQRLVSFLGRHRAYR